MGNQSKIEIENDFIWYRKGDKMSALDVLCKFCYVASKAISVDPAKNLDEKQARQKLMQLIFEGTGVLITDSGNISTRKKGGLKKAVYAESESGGYEKTEEGSKVKINRVLKMGSSDFDLAEMIGEKDYSSALHRVQLKQWNIKVPSSLSRVTDADFDRAVKASKHHVDIAGNYRLLESLKYAFNGVHRKDNPRAAQAKVVEPAKVDLDAARNLL